MKTKNQKALAILQNVTANINKWNAESNANFKPEPKVEYKKTKKE